MCGFIGVVAGRNKKVSPARAAPAKFRARRATPGARVAARSRRVDLFRACARLRMSTEPEFVWWWRSRLPERKGQRCRVIARGRLNSVLVEFEDGLRVVTSRYAVRAVSVASPTLPFDAGERAPRDADG